MTPDSPKVQFDDGKKVLYGALIISVLCIVGLAVGLAYPLVGQIKQEKDVLEESRLKLERVKAEMTETGKYQQLTQEIIQNKEKIDQIILTQTDIIPLIELFEKTAHDSDLNIVIEQLAVTKAKPAPQSSGTEAIREDLAKKPATSTSGTPAASSTPTPPPVPVDTGTIQSFMLTLDGDYKDFLTFLYKLENFQYAIKINAIDVNRRDQLFVKTTQDGKKQSGTITAKIAISFSVQN